MILRLIHNRRLLVCLTPILLWNLSVFGADESPSEKTVPNAITVYVGPRGHQLFRTGFEGLVYDLGYSFRAGSFSQFKYRADSPFRLDRLSGGGYQPYLKDFTEIRDQLQIWFSNFRFNDPQVSAVVNNVSYRAEFSKFAIDPEYEALRRLQKRTGAVVALDVVANAFTVDVAQVRAMDLQNKWLGMLGLDNFHAETAPGSVPLNVKIPFYIDASPTEFKVTALDAATNAKSVNLATGPLPPLILPKISLVVNDQVLPFNEQKVNDLVNKKSPMLISALQTYIEQTVKITLPRQINMQLDKLVNHSLRETNFFDPLGQDGVKPGDRYKLNVQMTGIKQTADGLSLDLSALIDDPKMLTPALQTAWLAQAPMEFSKLNPRDYQLAVALNQGLINRLLQLNFNRNYFKDIAIGKDATITLSKMPVINLVQMPGEMIGDTNDRIRLRVAIQQATSGFKKIFVKGPVEVTFDLYLRLKKSVSNTSLDVQFDSIDENSILIPDKDIRFLGDIINAKKIIRNSLMKIADGWKIKPAYMAQNVSIPAFLGIQTSINSVTVDPRGYIVLLLNYSGDPK